MDTQVARIVAAYERATSEQLAKGHRWYADAHSIACECPDGVVTGALQLAALSPRLSWERNVDAARALWAGKPKPSGVLNVSWRNAQILWVNGPKVSNFAANILDPTDPYPVTVDRHAVAIAYGNLDRWEHERVLKRKGGYNRIAESYRLAAKELDVTTNTVQAVVWVVWRDENLYARAKHSGNCPTCGWQYDSAGHFSNCETQD